LIPLHENSVISAEKPVYSIEWAASIVKSLKAKYPRATDVLQEEFALSDNQLALILAKNDPFWPKFRDLVHQMEKVFKHTGRPSSQCTLLYRRQGLLAWVNRLSNENLRKRLLIYLDKLIERAMLKEQGIKGGGGGSVSDRGPQPYRPDFTPRVAEDYQI